MGIYRVGYVALLILVVFLGLTGCSGRDSGGSVLSPLPALPTEPLTNVRLVISGSEASLTIRAQTAEPPQVFFELRLLDRSSSSNSIVMLRKQAQVTAVNGSYSATTLFESVPVLPAIASMSINGGYLTAANNQPYKIWVGKKDLIAASENVISLVGAGDKSATDVSVNLLEKLITVPANVATLAQPIFAKVDEIVAALDLTSSTVYDDALKAYHAAFSSITVPADAEFQPPLNYASLAYPKKDSSVSLVMPAFKAASESWVLLMNRSDGSLTPTWSVPQATTGSIRASIIDTTLPQNSYEGVPLSGEHLFHKNLRKFPVVSGLVSSNFSSSRRSMRASVTQGSIETFKHILDSDIMTYGDITGVCKRINIHSNGRATYFFVDKTDENLANLDLVMAGLSDLWVKTDGIYDKNRQIFGEEPAGVFLSGDVSTYDESGSATYILVSTKISQPSFDVAGYFFSGDLFPQTNSNRKKIFFLQLPDISTYNSYMIAINSLASTAAHELQHMIHFWQKRAISVEQYNANAWLDEAMSGYAEHINGFSIASQKNQSKAIQVNAYFSAINRVTVNQWYSLSDGNAHYGKAYLFGVWLAQNYGNNGSVRGLLENGQVSDTAIDYFNGSEVVSVTYAKFLLALAVNDPEQGSFYGFSGLDLQGVYSFLYGLSNVQLTGPAKTLVNVSLAAGSGGPTVSPYAAAYVKITNGNGSNVTINATLPAGIALFQLQK